MQLRIGILESNQAILSRWAKLDRKVVIFQHLRF